VLADPLINLMTRYLSTNDSMEEYIEEGFEDVEEVNNFFEMRNLPAPAALKRQMIDTLDK
jgi:hypothetical protein